MDRRYPSYYKVRQVAHMLGVTDQTIYRWIKKGLITCIKLPSGHLRIPIVSFPKYLRVTGLTVEE
ncbi:MAG: helix-turn-helix domain-containing protein [Candidatus Bathyarchaeia archaeon]